ncbi:MAG: hypothetical protein KUG81_05180 [Gammaproteobacteria bacterium]|nr:hypothetical protein [Gammaproteobacteria bacterium]
MIAEVIKILRENDYYGCGEYTEIAKGKHELVTSWKGIKRKIKRQWRLRK